MNTFQTDPVLAVDWMQLVIGGALTLGLTAIVLLAIRGPLFAVLDMICGSEVAARFWTTFACVLMVMGPLFLVFTAAGGAANQADFVRRAVYLMSFGVIVAFLIMGGAVMMGVSAHGTVGRVPQGRGPRPAGAPDAPAT